jgi:HlyD family secretion protein
MISLRWLESWIPIRPGLVVPVVAVAAAFGVAAGVAMPPDEGAGPAETLAEVPVLPASGADAFESVIAPGVVKPTLLVEVGSQLSGDIVEILADFNDPVLQDQPLARLAPETYEAAVKEARAAYEVARADAQLRLVATERDEARRMTVRAELDVARARSSAAHANLEGTELVLERKEALAKRGTLPQAELDRARTELAIAAAALQEAEAEVKARQAALLAVRAETKMADADLRAAEAAIVRQQAVLDRARADLERTVIRSPIDGVVVARRFDVGQTVAASFDTPTLFTVARDLRQMEVHAKVDEADIGRIRTGHPASFTVDAFPERRFPGIVRQIRMAPSIVQNVVTYTIVITTDNRELILRPGMTALLRIETGVEVTGPQLSRN